MNFAKIIGCWLILQSLVVAQTSAPSDNSMPHLIHRDGRHALIVDGKPFLMLGTQVNNSSAWPEYFYMMWPTLAQLHVNTVEMPIYWEQFEPKEGQFDPSVIDAILSGAREHHLHLVLLWFGTFKNGSNHYMPAWMKLAAEKYPNATNGRGAFVDSPSVVTDATLQADSKAFAAFMAHLKQADSQHTVILVQVENETGMWGSVRDHSPEAEKLFGAAVPAEALKALNKSDAPAGATWSQAFGRDADEFFQAWTTARFVGQVAAAGKAVYPLPLYVNASVRDAINPAYPPNYQVGGPNDNVNALWKAAAPAIDILSPDIYARDEAHFEKLFDAFTQLDNPLLVPETSGQGPTSRFFYAALNHGAIGYSPFGIDGIDVDPSRPDNRVTATAANYAAIEPMASEIAELNFNGKLQAVVESDSPPPTSRESRGEPAPDRVMHFGNWDVRANFGLFNRQRPTTRPAGLEQVGRVLAAELGEGQFLVTGLYTRLDFRPTGPLAGKPWQYLKVEEGYYDHGQFHTLRILNGDQTDWGVFLKDRPVTLRVSVYTR